MPPGALLPSTHPTVRDRRASTNNALSLNHYTKMYGQDHNPYVHNPSSIMIRRSLFIEWPRGNRDMKGVITKITMSARVIPLM